MAAGVFQGEVGMLPRHKNDSLGSGIGYFSARTTFPRFKKLAALATSEQDHGELESEFMRYTMSSGKCWPLENRRPTPLMPPSTVVKVQMESLMRNDWPDDNSGIKTAFDFTIPFKAEEIFSVKKDLSTRTVRAWDESEKYLKLNEFLEFFKDSAYAPLINCSNWQAASPVLFRGQDDRRATQTVEVTFTTSRNGTARKQFTFTLQKVSIGAYKDCWLVTGAKPV